MEGGCMAKDKRQGPRRGEYCGRPSRQARLHTATKESLPPRMDHAKACIHGHPQYSPRRPFLPLRTCIHEPSSFGRHPPLGGGRMRAHAPFSKYLSTISRPSSPSTIIPEEPTSFPVEGMDAGNPGQDSFSEVTRRTSSRVVMPARTLRQPSMRRVCMPCATAYSLISPEVLRSTTIWRISSVTVRIS